MRNDENKSVRAFRMGMDCRPDWFMDEVTANKVITYAKNKSDGPFEFMETYADIITENGIIRANYGDYIIKVRGRMHVLDPARLIFKKARKDINL
ncbi:hypothetical protein [Listeria innocua]|uniref:hypothetical protein n=1 Tax=Listeria innocua TaxID=1642 RepID=UPI0010E96DD2|nr:hypothetical protein [Listeria innocua]EAD5297061.1 hypothetical protein [Listeria monocytogenes]MBC2132052.1 hypothetical protein [Listeria innocua]